MIARMPRRRAAMATPRAWLPDEKATTPRSRSSAESCSSRLVATRSLHEPPSGLGRAGAPPVPSGSRAAPVLAKLRPLQPVTLMRPHAARRAARFFVEKFPGRSLYAVKENPSPDLLRILWDAGITHYDVASIGEVRLVRETLPEAVQCFMHPVKAEEVIAEAYFVHGVRTFSLDTVEELDKIVRATSKDGVPATDLYLLVRIRVSSDHAKLSLAAKFGADPRV